MTVLILRVTPSSTSLTVVTVRSTACYSEVAEGWRWFVHEPS